MTETGKRCAGPPPCLNTECFFHGKSAKFPGSGCRCEQETSVEDCPAGRLGDGLGVLLTMETREESDGRRCARRTCGLADTKAGPEGPWATCRAEAGRKGREDLASCPLLRRSKAGLLLTAETREAE